MGLLLRRGRTKSGKGKIHVLLARQALLTLQFQMPSPLLELEQPGMTLMLSLLSTKVETSLSVQRLRRFEATGLGER